MSIPNFQKHPLIPAIIQDPDTRTVLMQGYMNLEAFEKTLETKKVWFYSRSKERLWMKGETSSNVLEFSHYKIDCDADSILVYARPTGPVCHTGSETCFNERVTDSLMFLSELTEVIKERHQNPSTESYVSQLFAKGVNKIAQKVGEEAVEVVIEAKDSNDELFLNEAADLVFHLMILLEEKNYSLSDVSKILASRHR
ncbi:MAG: bifunctional phosphoribosyl-AMP cyclohydrolase/phosphoribosyl-ATP diphosphatase HisIE [Bacteroidetes bacterium]|nr:bifunctional phosphoribosyl-AMP cyclohydrolase/phosphoribosyl-ATP diphosphatase HisIE [Bacteroidota bacterium]